MKIDILTLFPKMFTGPFAESIINRAVDKKLVEINIHDLRKWGKDARKTVDDRPYGGGVGMILRVDVVEQALSDINSKSEIRNPKWFGAAHHPELAEGQYQNSKRITSRGSRVTTVLLDAGGKKYSQKTAIKFSKLDHLILICGHYEGVDHRVAEHLVDEVISIGDYVLTGGEIPAMVLVDSIVRLIPNVLEKPEAVKNESFSYSNNLTIQQFNNLLEFPQYTRPEEYNGWKVPKLLLSGNHKEIEKWRAKESEKLTKKYRPDLLK
jgi:tRNA (guanine37-N1)-methyltransferase